MKNMTLIRNLLLAAVMAVGMTESSVAATSWFNGGVNANWPNDATGGDWYCQNIANLKWTETFIPGVDTTVPGVTLDNWAYVGLKFTATQALGLSDDVTEATFSTTVLLAPVLKEEMPSVDSADKGGVLLVHEDDGSLRYYVVAQNDEVNGTGANVWKLASSIPRVTVDAAPVVIGIRFYRDGERWLVDYTVDGVTEPPHVVSFGSASTIESVRFTGPCTVQSLSATYENSQTQPDDPDTPAQTYDITITPPQNGTLTASATSDIAAGTTVTVTATPATGYQLVSVTTNGAPISGSSFTMPAADVTLAAAFEAQLTPPDDKAFYVNGKGYDSWSDAMNAAGNGGTVSLGADAEISGTQMYSLTIDLCGHTLTASSTSAPYIGGVVITVSDSVGGGLFTVPNGMNLQGTIDLSALVHDQFAISGNRFWTGSATVAKFPAGWTIDECTATFRNKVVGSKIVVQGVTYTYDGSAWISDSPVVTYSITITAPQNGTLETSVTNDVAVGASVTVTATPATGYQLVSVTTNGAPISGSSFTMPAADVTLAATFEELPPTPVDPTQMFYIGETGYDSWAEAYSAAKNGDTIKVGKDAQFAVSGGKAITIDLCGRSATWNSGGYAYTGAITLVDSGTPSGSGSLILADGNQNTKTTVDLSALTASQISGTGRFYFGPDTKVIFPSDMSYDACMGRINFQQTTAGSKIVVQGVNYEWNGSAWISDSPAETYSITITAPQNGTLETSVTNDVAVGATVTVTATPATGYQLVSVTTNGAPITGSSFTMPAADVTLAATFEELPPTPVDPTQMFYIGETGYDSWAEAKAAARDGDTIKVGKDAVIPNPGGTLSGSVPVDLCGRSLTFQGGWLTSGSFTFIDSVGGGVLSMPNGLNCSTTLDLSGLSGEQVVGINKNIKVGDSKSLVKFPEDWDLRTCNGCVNGQVLNARIVVQGVTYKWNGSIWVSDRVRIFDVDCELATDGTHAKSQIMIATNWLAEAFGEICPDGEVADANAKELIEEKLNAADAVNGLNHVWMNYVLGAMLPGDEDGRIWIRADQTSDPSALRFSTHEFSPIQDCGFSVRFRLPEKTSADDDFVRGDTYSASSTFEASVASDTLTHRVIDMIFIPDGSKTSCEYVSTVNTAGVLKVVSEKKVNLLSAPWCGFSPTNNPAVKATDFVKAACLSENDLLYVYDNEHQNYIAWAVQPDGTWAAVKTYVLANGVAAESAADATRTNDIPRGAGVWLERKDTTKPIFLYGQVGASQVTTSLAPGYNLVANPYPTAFDASSLTAPVKGGEEGDHIVIPTGGAPINAYYKDGGWGWFKDEVVEVVPGVSAVSPSWTTEGLTVPAGQGFWYLNSGTDAVELAWPTSADGKDE